MSHIVLNHWHTSEIVFSNATTAQTCLLALRACVEGEQIVVHGQGAELMFEGHFDFAKFDNNFTQIISNHLSSPTKYSIKNIFNDDDGYFGGWVMVCNEKDEVLKESSLNEIFEGDH